MNIEQRAIQRELQHRVSCASEGGCQLLADIHQFVGRFVAYPSEHARLAHALWVVHTHMMDAWESTPRIAFLSPEPGSGKTRALEISQLLVPRPVEAINATPAYLFRKVSDPEGLPTILFDEIDTLFGARAREHEEIRGILNAGHRRGAMAGRCVVRGKVIETEELPAYCPVALAGLGNLPDTILTRSVIVRMRRRAPSEKVEPFRHRMHQHEGHGIRQRIEAWACQITEVVKGYWPPMPVGIADRDADVWESLLTIADAAGGDWPDRARTAAVALVSSSKDNAPSLGVRLLTDIRTVFADRDQVPTAELLTALVQLDESPWADLRGKQIDARRLANMLKEYAVKPKQIRDGDKSQARGYARVDFEDAWSRYLPALSAECVTSVTGVATQAPDGQEAVTASSLSVASVTKVPGISLDATCVTAVTDSRRETSVHCHNCGWLDAPGTCGNFERPVEPGVPRVCTGFIQKIA